MDQDQAIFTPTEMDWDDDGEMQSEDLKHLMNRLQAMEGCAESMERLVVAGGSER